MTTIMRRITKEGIKIQGKSYYSPQLATMLSQMLAVDVPEGPLPQTLSAVCVTLPQDTQACSTIQLYTYDESQVFRNLDRINQIQRIGKPYHTLTPGW